MTIHKKRKPGGRIGNNLRITTSLDADTYRIVEWLAEKRGVPAANVARDAIWAYTLCHAATVKELDDASSKS